MKSDMLVDISHHDDRLNINVDIVFPRMPCDVLSLDVQDVMGTHIVDISGSLFKKRLSQEGKVLSQTSMLDQMVNRQDLLNRVKEELDQKQGCLLQGFFQINRVPGNFHISPHAFQDILMVLSQKGYSFDFTYQINHVSFGVQEDLQSIQRKFKNLGVLNPLDSLKTEPLQGNNNKLLPMQTNFYLIAVPSYFKDTRGNNYHVYQLTANHDTNHHSQQNMLLFNYELSPITVQFRQESENIFEFLVHICAIVGGIFTVAGIIDALIHRSVSVLFKKRIGKLI